MLVGPLDWKHGALVIIDTPNIVAPAIVVLRVKKSVGIIPLSPCLIQSVIGTPVKSTNSLTLAAHTDLVLISEF